MTVAETQLPWAGHGGAGALPDFQVETTEPALRLLADDLGLKAGQLFGVVRVAVTGEQVSPPLFETMAVLGQARCLERLDRAAALLDQAQA